MAHYDGPQFNQHIIDWLSAKLHGGVSLTQAMNDPGKAAELVARAMKPVTLLTPTS